MTSLDEQRFRRLIDYFPNGSVTVFNRDLIVTAVGSAEMTDAGISPDKYLGKRLDEIAPPDTTAIAEPAIRAAFEGTVGSYNVPYKDRQHAVRVLPLRDASGAVAEVLAVSQDVTQVRQAQHALRQAQGLLGPLLELAPVSIYVVTLDGRFLLVNRQWEFDTQTQRDEAIGRTVFDIFPAGLAQAYADTNVKVAEHGARSLEEWAETPNGLRCYYTVKFPLHDADGKVDSIGGLSIDITERKQAEDALQANERRFRALIENSADAITLINAHGHVVYDSPAAPGLLGYGPDDWIGHDVFELIHPADAPALGQLLQDLVAAPRASLRSQFRLRRADDSWAWLEAVATNLLDDPAVAAIVVNYRDITERKQAEQALQQAQAFAQSTVDALTAHLAILDERGVIVAVNDAWRQFAAANAPLDTTLHVSEGVNYLAVCDASVGPFADEAPVIAAGIRDVISGRRQQFALEYPCHALTEKRWFTARVTRFAGPGPARVVVAHENITERMLAAAAREKLAGELLLLLESTAEGIYGMDLDGRCTFINKAGAAMLGWPADELLGLNMHASIHHTHADGLPYPENECPIFRAVRQGTACHVENDVLWRRDGVSFTAAFSSHPIMDHGVQTGAVVTFSDITARKRAETERQVLLDIMQAAVFSPDAHEFLGRVHQAIARVIRAENLFVVLYNPRTGLFDEVYSVDRFDPIGESSRLEKSATAYVFRTGQPLLLTAERFAELVAQGEMELVGTDSPSWVGVPLKTAAETIGVMVVQDYDLPDLYTERDIDFLVSIAGQAALAVERKRAEDALRESENRFRIALLNSPVIVFSQDLDLRYTWIYNPHPGFDRQAVLGRTDAELLPLEDADQLTRLKRRVLETGQTARGEVHSTIDGQLFFYDLTVEPLLDAGGGLIGVTCASVDITARKQRERELEAIAAISTALRRASTRAEMLPIILNQLLQLLQADGALIETLLPASGEMLVELGAGKWASATGRTLPAGAGISAQVVATGQPYHSDDVTQDPNLRYSDLFQGYSATAGVPMIAQGQVIGLLWFGRQRPVSQHDLRLLAATAEIAANALNRETLREQAVRQMQRLAALRDVDQAISSSFDLRMTLHVILEQVVGQLKVDAANVMLLKPHALVLEHSASRGFRGRNIESVRVRLGEGLAGRAALERRTVNPSDSLARDPARAALMASEGLVWQIAAPLIAKGQVKGVLEVYQRTEIEPDLDWINFFETLAAQIAIAIDSAQLFDDLQRSNLELWVAYDATIEGWSRALDLRDRETEGHSLRVTELTLMLAPLAGIREDDMVHIRRGALLHDIGKMGVPDSILHKPGALSDAEWVIMRRHPQYAHDMLAPIAYLRPALDIPFCHHEKWDGTGYPRGIKAEQIPLAARLFALVDVWDALRSDRPYRPAWTRDQTLDYIQAQVGAHFDPRLVDIFLRSIHDD